ncbi:MAG: DASH family cryptochrome, partial [Proteobacteria bacterium]|nr:DASH family cryptochrome [Pseudomonadota bacterium]
YGAYLFQYFLKDYDPSSNWGNWQYLAGVGRDPRGLRFFNLQTQLERYNPDGSYLAQWGNQKDFLAHL